MRGMGMLMMAGDISLSQFNIVLEDAQLYALAYLSQTLSQAKQPSFSGFGQWLATNPYVLPNEVRDVLSSGQENKQASAAAPFLRDSYNQLRPMFERLQQSYIDYTASAQAIGDIGLGNTPSTLDSSTIPITPEVRSFIAILHNWRKRMSDQTYNKLERDSFTLTTYNDLKKLAEGSPAVRSVAQVMLLGARLQQEGVLSSDDMNLQKKAFSDYALMQNELVGLLSLGLLNIEDVAQTGQMKASFNVLNSIDMVRFQPIANSYSESRERIEATSYMREYLYSFKFNVNWYRENSVKMHIDNLKKGGRDKGLSKKEIEQFNSIHGREYSLKGSVEDIFRTDDFGSIQNEWKADAKGEKAFVDKASKNIMLDVIPARLGRSDAKGSIDVETFKLIGYAYDKYGIERAEKVASALGISFSGAKADDVIQSLAAVVHDQVISTARATNESEIPGDYNPATGQWNGLSPLDFLYYQSRFNLIDVEGFYNKNTSSKSDLLKAANIGLSEADIDQMVGECQVPVEPSTWAVYNLKPGQPQIPVSSLLTVNDIIHRQMDDIGQLQTIMEQDGDLTLQEFFVKKLNYTATDIESLDGDKPRGMKSSDIHISDLIGKKDASDEYSGGAFRLDLESIIGKPDPNGNYSGGLGGTILQEKVVWETRKSKFLMPEVVTENGEKKVVRKEVELTCQVPVPYDPARHHNQVLYDLFYQKSGNDWENSLSTWNDNVTARRDGKQYENYQKLFSYILSKNRYIGMSFATDHLLRLQLDDGTENAHDQIHPRGSQANIPYTTYIESPLKEGQTKLDYSKQISDNPLVSVRVAVFDPSDAKPLDPLIDPTRGDTLRTPKLLVPFKGDELVVDTGLLPSILFKDVEQPQPVKSDIPPSEKANKNWMEQTHLLHFSTITPYPIIAQAMWEEPHRLLRTGQPKELPENVAYKEVVYSDKHAKTVLHVGDDYYMTVNLDYRKAGVPWPEVPNLGRRETQPATNEGFVGKLVLDPAHDDLPVVVGKKNMACCLRQSYVILTGGASLPKPECVKDGVLDSHIALMKNLPHLTAVMAYYHDEHDYFKPTVSLGERFYLTKPMLNKADLAEGSTSGRLRLYAEPLTDITRVLYDFVPDPEDPTKTIRQEVGKATWDGNSWQPLPNLMKMLQSPYMDRYRSYLTEELSDEFGILGADKSAPPDQHIYTPFEVRSDVNVRYGITSAPDYNAPEVEKFRADLLESLYSFKLLKPGESPETSGLLLMRDLSQLKDSKGVVLFENMEIKTDGSVVASPVSSEFVKAPYKDYLVPSVLNTQTKPQKVQPQPKSNLNSKSRPRKVKPQKKSK